MKISRQIIIGILLCVATQITAQKKELNKEVWNDAVNGVEYIEGGENKLKQQPSESSPKSIDDYDRTDRKRQDNSYEPPEKRDHSIPAWLSTFFIIVVVGLLLYFIVLTVVKNPNLNIKKKSTYQLNEDELKNIEENPFDNDLEQHIHEAKTSGNLKLAIRLSFIYIIRLLSENKLITWKKDKTNSQYLRELAGKDFKSTYAYLKLLFETTWYGEIDLRDEEYSAALERFDNGIHTLKSFKDS